MAPLPKPSVELSALTLSKPLNTCVLVPPAARSVLVMVPTALTPLISDAVAQIERGGRDGVVDDSVVLAMPVMLPPMVPPVRMTVSASTSPAIVPPEMLMRSMPALPAT